ncbi:SRPBCC domain-containing protein [Spirillospora sp. NPDC048911]|uniref:SRPBCC family protein n=1 Tax=Spirillospora sp. NPDC048911 TaxID=3364527 RepID=UPI003711CFA0
MGHEFEVHKEITLAASPEDVWDAIATGPGVDAWFMGRSEIEPREGGATTFTMAGTTETSTVTGWEPAKRFAYRTEPGEDGAFMAMEYLIEGRDGGATVLRMVHSGILGGDWETEYEAMKTGWDMYLHTLGQYLVHFRGRHAGTVTAFRPGVPAEGYWTALKARLGLGSSVAEGDRVSLSAEGVAPIEGVVDYVDLPTFLGVRTDDALYRFIHSGAHRGSVAVAGHHLFAPDVDAAQAEKAWQAWLNELPVG